MGFKDKLEAEAKELAAKAKDAYAHKDELVAKAKKKLEDGEAELAAEATKLKEEATDLAAKAKKSLSGKFKGTGA